MRRETDKREKEKKGAMDFYGDSSVMSATECTGMTPAAIESDAEEASYQDIYDIPLEHREPRPCGDLLKFRKDK